jgi:hypothetical protein
MEKHEKCEARGQGASFDRVAGGILRVPSLQHSNPGLLYKQTQSVGGVAYKQSQFAPDGQGRPSPGMSPPNKANPGRPAVQTNPIAGGAVAPNKANSPTAARRSRYPCFQYCIGLLRSRGAGCTNKPNRRGPCRTNKANPRRAGREMPATKDQGGRATGMMQVSRTARVMSLAKTQRSPRTAGPAVPRLLSGLLCSSFAPLASWREEISVAARGRAGSASCPEPTVQTNPIGGGAVAPNEANRSAATRRSRYPSIPPFHRSPSLVGAGCTNKANRWGACCTNKANWRWTERRGLRVSGTFSELLAPLWWCCGV